MMMECSFYFHMVLLLLFSLASSSLVFLSLSTHSMVVAESLSKKRGCHDDEKAALLQFKHNFVSTNQCNSYWLDVHPKPKLESWKEGGDCCSWEGVECDDRTGRVVGLDVSESCLFGSINSSSSLFTLLHLQRLNLSYNDFRYSHIPSAIENLSSLTHLHLKYSYFTGQIPQQLSNITTLVSLDLSYNFGDYGYSLGLEVHSLKGLVQHMINLKELHLSYVNLSSSGLQHLCNFSSIESLLLVGCELRGEFPVSIFHLPKLKMLNLRNNQNLKGYLPNFRLGSPLQSLDLSETSFGGVLPSSIGNLASLEHIDISYCNFTGKLPMSLGNLTQLVSLNLWGDTHFGPVSKHFSKDSLTTASLSWISKLTKLTHLNLALLDLTGEIPSWLMNLTQLINIDLSHNQFIGPIPSNFNHLIEVLDLSYNNLEGVIPPNLSNLHNPDRLSLAPNRFVGSVELNIFSHLKKLTTLILSYNHLSLSVKNISTKNFISFPSLEYLGLASCNLSEFPTIQHNNKNAFEYLDLSDNNLSGQIPPWIFDLGQNSEDGLYLNISHNHLTGFERDNPLFHHRAKIRTLDLRHNMLQGSLPIPPPFPFFSSYLISNNRFSGQVSHLICNFTFLKHLDLSFNNLSGKLPQCLSNFSDSLSLLDLGGNKFDGNIPSAWNNECNLRMITMSQNQLQGQLPRSLANCSSLEFIDFGYNKITDTFPLWLETVTQLSVLILRSNRLHGVIRDGFGFPNLRVINLSNNSFSGKMPSKFIETSNPMRALNASHMMGYMEQSLLPNSLWDVEDFGQFDYSMTINNKGLERSYMKIPDTLCGIDFSSNNFEGQIPDTFGDLTGLQLLNLSRNLLTGHIPFSFSNMKILESLDLSRNQVSGRIPMELTKLTSLSSFDVSYNNLFGPIPQGNQFCTFSSASFEGNPGLFAEPWNKQCGNARSLPQPQQPPSTPDDDDNDSESDSKIKWMIILIGFVIGLIVGVILGNELTTSKHYWFVKTFAGIRRW